MNFVVFLMMIGLTVGDKINFLNSFYVSTTENSSLSYDSERSFAIITKPNISYAFYCTNSNDLRYFIKNDQGCFNGTAYCEDLQMIIESYDEFKVITDGVPDNVDFMYDSPCAIGDGWFVGNCSFYGREKDPDVYREIWVVMDLNNGYFPGVYYHFGKKKNVMFMYNLLKKVGPTMSDIESWIQKNCEN